jgi:hypothetical protein
MLWGTGVARIREKLVVQTSRDRDLAPFGAIATLIPVSAGRAADDTQPVITPLTRTLPTRGKRLFSTSKMF